MSELKSKKVKENGKEKREKKLGKYRKIEYGELIHKTTLRL